MGQKLKDIRDAVLLLLGAGGYMYMFYAYVELGVEPNAYLVVLCGGALGLPAFFRLDELVRKNGRNADGK